jgi:ribonuclease HI
MPNIEVYCKGLNAADKSGYGIVLIYEDIIKELSGPITRNNPSDDLSADLIACSVALKGIVRKDIPVVVHSENQLLVNTINNRWKRRSNHDLWKNLESLISNFQNVNFKCVHLPHKWKDRAHDLAQMRILDGKIIIGFGPDGVGTRGTLG